MTEPITVEWSAVQIGDVMAKYPHRGPILAMFPRLGKQDVLWCMHEDGLVIAYPTTYVETHAVSQFEVIRDAGKEIS